MTSPQFLEAEELLEEICRLAHKHEVQSWLDANGTDAEKLEAILPLARELLHRHRHADDVYRRESR